MTTDTLDLHMTGLNEILLTAARHGHQNVVKLMIEQGADINYKADYNSITLLHYASKHAHVTVAKFLVKQGADMKATTEVRLETPLHYASMNGHVEVVQFFLDKGAPINLQTSDGYSPLHLASTHGHSALVMFLLQQGAYVDIKDKYDKRTPLHMAILKQQFDVVKLLVDNDADMGLEDSRFRTAFSYSRGKIQDYLCQYKRDAPLRRRQAYYWLQHTWRLTKYNRKRKAETQ